MIKTASNNQRKMFFALARELGYESLVVKERAKAFFKLDSFKDATSAQLNLLIDRLQERKETRV